MFRKSLHRSTCFFGFLSLSFSGSACMNKRVSFSEQDWSYLQCPPKKESVTKTLDACGNSGTGETLEAAEQPKRLAYRPRQASVFAAKGTDREFVANINN
ncbi:hypothetical protein B0X71_06480 [Planococcus lenghuensis]|uniref:Secreted protein n=1 Tax=Planococcus lenghuensis TaxID=2213202 RepID=A0A1Q2KX93_9BACL|nr:hypothetical protein B0X71_06480 [Planococcus lenghuensis]